MSNIDDLINNNSQFVENYPAGHLDVKPSRHTAVVACMDSRLDVFGALGLDLGEAHVIRNAGGIVSDDVIRSLAISQRRLGTTDIIVIQHTDCGMMKITDDGFRQELQEATGVAPGFAIESFTDLEGNVRQSLERLRNSRFLAHRDNIRGFIYDVDSGALNEIA